MQKAFVLALGLAAGGALLARPAQGGDADKKMRPSQSNVVGHWIRRWSGPDDNERSHATVRQAFREIVEPVSRSTVRVLCDDLQVSSGTIVHADGYILAKASEVDDALTRPSKLPHRLECLLYDQRRLVATPVVRRESLDLVLLKINAQGLTAVPWSDGAAPPVGSWLATPTIEDMPTAVGVVGLMPHAVPTPRTVLGLGLDRIEQGVRVTHVFPGSGAAIAGIRPGDVIASINGRSMDSPATLTNLIRRMQPGEKVRLDLRRSKELISVTATLGDDLHLGQQEQAELMDSLGGPLSRRRTGFSSVLQHDSVLRPRDCGGPVVDLDGNVVGINIARASRVATYALPTRVVRPAATEMVEQAISDLARRSPPETIPVLTNTAMP